VIGNIPPPMPASVACRPRSNFVLPGHQSLPRRSVQQLHLSVVIRRPQGLDLARTAGNEYTICTAIVFTIRTHGLAERMSRMVINLWRNVFVE
jgi:hypothetical protein